MAGAFPGGPAAAQRFRDGIHYAMNMGAPEDDELAVTFVFDSAVLVDGPADASGVPFDPDAELVGSAPQQHRVPYAIEYYDARGQLTGLGIINATRVEITVLDEEYEQIRDAVAVIINGNRFNRRKEAAPMALFSVNVHVMHFDAVDNG